MLQQNLVLGNTFFIAITPGEFYPQCIRSATWILSSAGLGLAPPKQQASYAEAIWTCRWMQVVKFGAGKIMSHLLDALIEIETTLQVPIFENNKPIRLLAPQDRSLIQSTSPAVERPCDSRRSLRRSYARSSFGPPPGPMLLRLPHHESRCAYRRLPTGHRFAVQVRCVFSAARMSVACC